MPKAGYCSECGTNVWLLANGSCANGHGAECVSGVYEDPGSPPAPQSQAPAPERKSAQVGVAVLVACVVVAMGVGVVGGYLLGNRSGYAGGSAAGYARGLKAGDAQGQSKGREEGAQDARDQLRDMNGSLINFTFGDPTGWTIMKVKKAPSGDQVYDYVTTKAFSMEDGTYRVSGDNVYTIGTSAP
jgi:hypothetical protein